MRRGSSEALPPSRPILAPIPEPQAPSLRPNIVRRPQRVTANVLSTDELAWRARAIPALAHPIPLTFDEIQPAPLEVRPLVTTPLSVPAIEEEDENKVQ